MENKEVEALVKRFETEPENYLEICHELVELGVAAIEPLINIMKCKEEVMHEFTLPFWRSMGLRAFPETIRRLNDGDEDSRDYIIHWALYGIGEEAAKPLIEMLLDENRSDRAWIVSALGTIGSIESVDALIRLLGNEDDSELVEDSVFALGAIGDQRALNPLLSMLNNDLEDIRGTAASALGNLRNPAAVKPLMKLLDLDPDELVREYAAYSLGEIGDARAVPSLTRALRNDTIWSVRSSSASVLSEFDEYDSTRDLLFTLRDEDSYTQKKAAKTLGRTALPLNMKRISRPIFGGEVTADDPIIQEIRDYVATDRCNAILEEIFDAKTFIWRRSDLVSKLKDEVRNAAVGGLESMVRNAAQAEKAAQAIAALGDNRTYAEVKVFSELLCHENADVRMTAAWAMGMKGRRSIEFVNELMGLLNDEDFGVRMHALTALGSIGGGVVDRILCCLEDEHYRVRANAALALGDLRAKQAIPRLKQSAHHDEMQFVRSTCWKALQRFDIGIEEL